MPKAARDPGIDQAKGVLIVLVVLGHIVPSSQPVPDSFDWYLTLRRALYLFHMPAFFYVSGLISLKSLERLKTAPIFDFIRKRADRLLVPFFVVGLTIALGKALTVMALGKGGFGGHVSMSLTGAVDALFWHTRQSPAQSIWFLVVYFLFLCAAVPFIRLRHWPAWLTLVGLVIYVTGGPAILYLNKAADHFVFFAAGLWSAKALDLEDRMGRWLVTLVMVLAACVFAASTIVEAREWYMLVYGLAAGPLIVALSRRFPDRLMAWFGRNTMPIYIFNTMVIGVVSTFLLKVLHLSAEQWFVGSLVVGMPLALLAPIALKHVVSDLAPRLAAYMS